MQNKNCSRTNTLDLYVGFFCNLHASALKKLRCNSQSSKWFLLNHKKKNNLTKKNSKQIDTTRCLSVKFESSSALGFQVLVIPLAKEAQPKKLKLLQLKNEDLNKNVPSLCSIGYFLYSTCNYCQKAYQTVRSSKVLLRYSEKTSNLTPMKATKNNSRHVWAAISEVLRAQSVYHWSNDRSK